MFDVATSTILNNLNLVGNNGITIIDTGVGSTIALSTSGVTAATYGSGSSIPVMTVDQYGRVTSVSIIANSANSFTADTGLTSPSFDIFALDLNRANTWIALQTFNNGIGFSDTTTITSNDTATDLGGTIQVILELQVRKQLKLIWIID